MIPDFLTTDDVEQIRTDLTGLIQDEQIASNIMYRHITSNAFNPITGKNAQTYTEYHFKACGGQYTIFEIARSNGLLRVGDTLFTLMSSDVAKLMAISDLFYVQVTDAGEVSLSIGSTELEGIDTTFKSSGVQPGDVIAVNGSFGVIGSVTEEDEGTLRDPWVDDNWEEIPYIIYRQYSIIQIGQDLLGLTARISVRRSGG